MTRLPTEPSTPSGRAGQVRLVWLGGWLAGAGVGLIVLIVLWVADARTEVLALVGTGVAGAVAVALHHLVVTQDLGERTAARPDTSQVDLASRLGRRQVLAGLGAAAVAGAVALTGLLRFGSPAPTGSTWADGVALASQTGDRLRPEDIPLGGVVTVWPEGEVGAERTAVMVIRLREPAQEPTRLDGIADDTLVAYSRLCTHAGCAVALYRDVDQALFCPCHQATFDARRGARPTAGPASVPLPQLPLAVHADGHLIATGDLTARPGPASGTVRT
ncbi:MAG: Rieske 2Fe-2S domain-containing protein [Nitriliruptoraceae bacterium]|nr:Rieske 2Fe-2S domain-containing protein [Nitriliruptoraceae bacterium]